MRQLSIGLLLILPLATRLCANEPSATPEARALRYLAREVPRWSRENRCYSCHNNGDGARALYTGLRRGELADASALDDTTAWLREPGRWDHNGGDGPFSDKRLARVQFTAALVTARAAGVVTEANSLREAVDRLARDQAADGSWPLEGDDPNTPGAPAAYGQPLATYLAREALRFADAVRFREPIARAGRWLAKRPIRTVADASVALMALGAEPPSLPARTRDIALTILRKAQSADGGWGPFAASPSEVFDTSLAVLGLVAIDLEARDRRLIERGRAFLIAGQQPDGSWIETTRPSGAESYAERISTTGWAALALMAGRR